MKSLESTKRICDEDQDEKNVPKLEPVEVVSVHCKLVKNDYQHTLQVFFTFAPNKQFEKLKNISPLSLTMMNTVNAKFSFV